jgi:thiol-disulfide isomerase/thioredoxin
MMALVLRGSTEMLGPVTRESVLKNNPDWHAVVSAYNPKPGSIEALRTVSEDVTVEVYFGTWCPDSKAHVSEFFKVLDLADNPHLRAVYTAVPRDRAQRVPYYGMREVERLPAFLVFVDGREIGRIVETPEKSVEEDLVQILDRQAPRGAAPPRPR